ncbi:MAG: hypothetical protein HYS20_11885 [Rhodocyclales bacterium]|nr:hypothetical protein [Rhodocyclales bacterium]
MSREKEDLVRGALSSALEVDFGKKGLRLSEWGRSDGLALLLDQTHLILEVENTQKHPDTNVLKLWPYLTENPAISVVLIQVFVKSHQSLNGSRQRLAGWLARKMEQEILRRFKYYQLVFEQPSDLGCEATLCALREEVHMRQQA